ncbi:hypothetical protein [Streptomyces pseudovenezuelae]|uniref:hypothetical protein n=1 Tax=Streptomyces pseudovenezuelae TaxID=67350 RepID=UPI002E8107ED|nr:hypothetical protein [Streptomyces pseudovenezuelae]WUA93326.1 hypothetical protein OHO81_40950 [Streptomyces pseudovenezuelae]
MTAVGVGPGRDRHAVLQPCPFGATLVGEQVGEQVGGQVGSTRTAMTAGPGRDCRVALVPLSSRATRRRATTGITRTVVARSAARPAGSGQ